MQDLKKLRRFGLILEFIMNSAQIRKEFRIILRDSFFALLQEICKKISNLSKTPLQIGDNKIKYICMKLCLSVKERPKGHSK